MMIIARCKWWWFEYGNGNHLKVYICIIYESVNSFVDHLKVWMREALTEMILKDLATLNIEEATERMSTRWLPQHFDERKTFKLFLCHMPNVRQKCLNYILQVSDPVHGEEGEIPMNEMRWMIQCRLPCYVFV